jgi:hypothetical protein
LSRWHAESAGQSDDRAETRFASSAFEPGHLSGVEVAGSAGDDVTLDWETQQPELYMDLLPIGTTDFTFLDVAPLAQQTVQANYKAEATYTVPQDGQLPFEFKSDTGCQEPPAPYDFTATIQHGVVLSLTGPATLPMISTIAVGVHTPDGAPITIRGSR